VLGDEYVDRALASVTPLTEGLQQLVTEFCWGAVWTRPGLDLKTRSLCNIAMFVALNRPHELRTHIRGALRNGATKEEIVEVLLQGTVYCGVPAGIDSFRAAREVLEEDERASGGTGRD
jgi:4-carboxymuconolactone decarboxylase